MTISVSNVLAVGGGDAKADCRCERRPSPAALTNAAPAARAAVSSCSSNSRRLATTSAASASCRSGTARLIPRPESMKRAERIRTADRARARWAGAISARARPVMPPPHGFSRGCEGSMSDTRAPRRASRNAAQLPLGPAPTMVMWRVVDTSDRSAAPSRKFRSRSASAARTARPRAAAREAHAWWRSVAGVPASDRAGVWGGAPRVGSHDRLHIHG